MCQVTDKMRGLIIRCVATTVYLSACVLHGNTKTFLMGKGR